MDSGNSKANVWTRSAEDVELNDAILSTVAHELGGIATALDLRAAALARTIPPNDVAALRSLAEELRANTRAVRLLRGADASGKLAPSRQLNLNEWWRLVSKVSRVVLPSHIPINATFDDSPLKTSVGNALTWIWLCVCKDLAENDAGGPITLRGLTEDGTVVLRAEVPGTSMPGDSNWMKHAAQVATSIEATPPRWEHREGVVSWSFSLPPGA